jgi:hypothetical protein
LHGRQGKGWTGGGLKGGRLKGGGSIAQTGLAGNVMSAAWRHSGASPPGADAASGALSVQNIAEQHIILRSMMR